MDVSTGNITVGATTYCGQNPGFHLLVLQRQPDPRKPDVPDVLLNKTYMDASSVNTALQPFSAAPGGPLVLINAVGNYGFGIRDVADALASFGASTADLRPISDAISFIFIGNAGRNQQTALQRGYGTRNVDGYLAQDSNTNFAFMQTDFLHYDIDPDGTIVVGQNTFSVANSYRVNCDGQNAFHLVQVDRESPGTALVDGTYCTAQSDSEIQRLVGDLNRITSNFGDEGTLIFLASNGHPIPANWNFGTDGDNRIYPLAQEIAKLGGYWETMVYLTPSDTYSLVGAPPPPAGTPQAAQRARESSSVYPADVNGRVPTGELHGVLARGRGNWYSPLNSDPTGLANMGLYDILAQPSSPYPTFTGDQLTAFQYINQKLCGGNNCLRDSYRALSLSINGTYSSLQGMADPSNRDCQDSNADPVFCQVRNQLLPEVLHAVDIQQFYSNLDKLWAATGTQTILTQLEVFSKVQAALPKVDNNAPAPSLVEPLVNLFLNLASKAPVVGPAFGLADLFFNFGTKLATDSKGNQSIDLTSTIGTLYDQAKDQFYAQGNATGTFFELIMQDGGKLYQLGSVLRDQGYKTGSPWFWGGDTTSQILQSTDPVIEQGAYQSIMSAAYAIGSYFPNYDHPNQCTGVTTNPRWGQYPLWQQPRSYIVFTSQASCGVYNTIHDAQPFAPVCCTIYLPYTFPTDSDNPNTGDTRTGTILADLKWLGISSVDSPYASGPNGSYDPPDLSLLDHLFTPLAKGGLGVYRPAFFEGWPFKHVPCYEPGNGPSLYPGCDWASAKPLQTVLPGPLVTKLSLQANQIASSGNEIDVRLSILNSGTAVADSIEISSIALRTLEGSGQATLLDSQTPIEVGSLDPGGSKGVVLRISVPPSITKLGMVETGSLQGGDSQSVQLSEAQALYPQH